MGHLESPISIEGEDAYSRGEPKSDNPYVKGSEKHKEWNEGWEYEALFDRG